MVDSATRVELIPEIPTRRSFVAFDPGRPVEPEKIGAIVEAARWAPSSNNRQPWRVTLVERGETRDALNQALSGNNQKWAPNAPLLVVYAAAAPDPERPGQLVKLAFDCGLSAENLMLEGVHQGLRVHPMGGWDEAAVKAAIGIPEENAVMIVIAVGYPGNPDDLPEDTRPKEFRERVRRPAGEIFFSGRWGDAWEG